MTHLSKIVEQATTEYKLNNTIPDCLIAQLVKALINSEVVPGGPYGISNRNSQLLLNAKIEKLFLLLNKPLPLVQLHIRETLKQYPVLLSPELVLILDEIKQIKIAKSDKRTALLASKYILDAHNNIEKFLETFSAETGSVAEQIHTKIKFADSTGEISQLSRAFADSINPKPHIPSRHLAILGEANILVWQAYSLYDDVLDGDSPASNISTANILQRKSLGLYRALPYDQQIVMNYYDKVDTANAWETRHCRFDFILNETRITDVPSQQEMEHLLSNRAAAHIIGPLLIAEYYIKDSKQYQQIEKGLTYYCIARQLSDDLHDWVDDFENGRVTFVVAHLLRATNIERGVHDKNILLNKLKNKFYGCELEALCILVKEYITIASQLLGDINNRNGDTLLINQYFEPIARSAKKARLTHISNKKSIKIYS